MSAKMMVLALFGAIALAFGALSSAQQSQDNGEIVVTGERMRTILHDFVADISAPSGENQIARWDHRICTGVFGMTNREQAQFVADRIAQRAFSIGLDASPPGCRANIVIFITPDANALSHTLATEYRNLLAVHHDRNIHTRGLDALDGFANSTRPVRWWHVTDTVSQDGFRMNPANDHSAFNGEGSSMGMGARIRVFSPSRLRQAVRQDFNRVIIVVDARQAAGHRLDALADYLAMVSLAQLQPSIETASYPSVLNLFSSDQSVSGMTNFDIAYLDGLYHAPRNANSSREQEGRIVDRMDRTLNQPAPLQQTPATSP
jgi:hypothetical protein